MKAPKRIASAVINSLKGGVVPRIGLPYIAVGRDREIEALLHDTAIIADGGASFRFIVGRYGSGKSFLLQTVRNYAMDKQFVVADADLSPERRFQGTKGQGLATYKELIRNLSTKTRPDGGALPLILDRWISGIQSEVAATSGLNIDDPAFGKAVEARIYEVIGALRDMVHGFDFANLLIRYYRAFLDGDDDTRAKVIRWFRGEYTVKADVRAELQINILITDEDWYDYIKLFAVFLKYAGYAGLLILVDELVNLYKIPNAISRQYNYEKLLTMYNDTLQGKASYLGFILCATPTCLEDPRRGIYSYEALRSRLTQGRFANGGTSDLLAPVIRLAPLTNEELFVLTEKLRDLHADLYDYEPRLTEEDLMTFMQIEYSRIGADSHLTPREIIRDAIELLNIAYQHPTVPVETLMGSDTFSFATAKEEESIDAAFAEFDV